MERDVRVISKFCVYNTSISKLLGYVQNLYSTSQVAS